jgi:hypothetical protein
MLLLTTLTFGGGESVEVFDHLPEDDSALLKHRAAMLQQIPRDKRVPFLVQEIKRLVTARRKQLAAADPQRLSQVLAKERGSTIEVVLRALPSQLAEQTRTLLTDAPQVKLRKEVRPDILSIVRWKLEEKLKESTPKVGSFKFSDLLILQSRELLTISDRMGARALATAIAGMSDGDRENFFTALPPDQRSLAQRASEAGKTRKLSPEDSKTVLDIHGALKDPSAGMRSAGAQRIARACVAQGPEFAARVIERHNNELGRMLQKWVREERHKSVKGDGGRMDIVEQMERLAQRGVIDRPMRLAPPVKAFQVLPPSQSSQSSQRNPQLQPASSHSGQSSQLSPLSQVLPRASSQMLPQPPARKESGVLQPMPARRDSSQLQQAPRSPSQMEVARPDRGDRGDRDRGDRGERQERSERPEGPRRDMMAEREARRAGAMSNRVPQLNQGRPQEPLNPELARSQEIRRPPVGRQVKVQTDPHAKAVRIVREGKPLQGGPAPGKKAVTSPALQEIPKRRNAPREGTSVGRSPVLKDKSRGR